MHTISAFDPQAPEGGASHVLVNSIMHASHQLVVMHLQGVLAMSWSGHDAGLLLSSAKDNRTILWDVATGEMLGELSAGDNWDFDVLWSPSNPGVFATSSYGAGEGNSGKVSLPLDTVFQQLLLWFVTAFSCLVCDPMWLFSGCFCLLLLVPAAVYCLLFCAL